MDRHVQLMLQSHLPRLSAHQAVEGLRLQHVGNPRDERAASPVLQRGAGQDQPRRGPLSGGTRIGESLDRISAGYPGLQDRQTTVFLLSDGWETGSPEGLGRRRGRCGAGCAGSCGSIRFSVRRATSRWPGACSRCLPTWTISSRRPTSLTYGDCRSFCVPSRSGLPGHRQAPDRTGASGLQCGCAGGHRAAAGDDVVDEHHPTPGEARPTIERFVDGPPSVVVAAHGDLRGRVPGPPDRLRVYGQPVCSCPPLAQEAPPGCIPAPALAGDAAAPAPARRRGPGWPPGSRPADGPAQERRPSGSGT